MDSIHNLSQVHLHMSSEEVSLSLNYANIKETNLGNTK